MKKIFALLLMAVMSVTLLAGCGTDPVQADYEEKKSAQNQKLELGKHLKMIMLSRKALMTHFFPL